MLSPVNRHAFVVQLGCHFRFYYRTISQSFWSCYLVNLLTALPIIRFVNCAAWLMGTSLSLCRQLEVALTIVPSRFLYFLDLFSICLYLFMKYLYCYCMVWIHFLFFVFMLDFTPRKTIKFWKIRKHVCSFLVLLFIYFGHYYSHNKTIIPKN